jgi:multidrug resistance efflux pump
MRRLASILATALLVAGCGAGSTPPAVPTVVLDSGNPAPAAGLSGGAGTVIASGVVVAGQQARLAFSLAGRVESLVVAQGDQVPAGQTLLRLDGSAKLAAAVEAANLEVLAAQQALADLQAAAAMTAAQAQLAVANATEALTRAETALRQLAHPDLEFYQDQATRAQARLTAAQQNATVTNFETELRTAEDALETATNALTELQNLEAQYPGYSQQHGNALENAQKAFDRARQAHQMAQFRLQQAQANDASVLTEAQRAYDTARANLEAAQVGPDPQKLAIAQAQVAVAQAGLAEAEAQVTRLADGVDPDQLALAQARLSNAQAQRLAAQAALDDLELRAPFDGIVAELSTLAGEWVTPGQAVVLLSDLNQLQIETTDLSERDIPRIAVGQSAVILVKALNQELPGHVREIALQAETLGGDVVYRTTLDLDTWPDSLRVGMSVDVQIEAARSDP